MTITRTKTFAKTAIGYVGTVKLRAKSPEGKGPGNWSGIDIIEIWRGRTIHDTRGDAMKEARGVRDEFFQEFADLCDYSFSTVAKETVPMSCQRTHPAIIAAARVRASCKLTEPCP